ncbi:unnamed protein product [Protopolystoma xenopodis]|uniref:Uncharacterized protein n=1 Tax=Protopolystoma xenopodis TaxID=117903 RepID=A0A448X2T8_9PLAT|nr:unnamed protein product [Protopolystoma xenopodis]
MSASFTTCYGCGPCRPRWMKLVDNLYSGNPQDNSSHSKLTYFCSRKPEKVDRIANYLYRRMANDLHRRNYPYVKIAIEAINSLINACRDQRLNLLVVSFLKMIQLLLESNKPDLQILGTDSFIKFSQIEEDTPNYHRQYDDLVDHFSKMSHCSLPERELSNRIRVSGIIGIQGVIRKTARDQLQIDILQSSSMDKIIPSLLFNIHENPPLDTRVPDDSHFDPAREAMFVFKDIVCRASYTNIKPVVTSILT